MKRRIDWLFVIYVENLNPDFNQWLKKHCTSIRSLNRKAYCFIKSVRGMSFINFVRNHKTNYDYDEVVRILKTPWINVPEAE